MKQCLGCRGVVPETVQDCPNCQAERRPGLKVLVAAAGMVAQGKRERLVLKESAPGKPFDNGRFELVEEAFDAPDPKPPTPRELVKKVVPTVS
jgi:hypothetical protein